MRTGVATGSGQAYGGEVLRRLLSRLGYEPKQKREPDSVRELRRMAELLNDNGRRFRETASRVALLEQRVSILETEGKGWADRVSSTDSWDPALAREAARILGNVEGQLQAARAELLVQRTEETELRKTLTVGRKRFADLFEQTKALGHDVSSCLLYIDLSRPECPADETLLADDDRSFVARVIDRAGLH